MILCKCGCGQEIVIKKYHKWVGIPEYINGHFWKGKHHSEKTKQKMSDINKGKHHSEETKQKMSDVRCGKHPSEETKQKLSQINCGENNPRYGKRHSKESKQKISKATCGENNPRFNDWASRKPYCEKWSPQLREEIRNQYGRKCYICGKEEKYNITKNGKIRKLSVHHVDSDKEQGCNGKRWKLVPLCMNCHGKIHNKKTLNTNKA